MERIDNMVELADSIQDDCNHADKVNRENQELAARIQVGVQEYSDWLKGFDYLQKDIQKRLFSFGEAK